MDNQVTVEPLHDPELLAKSTKPASTEFYKQTKRPPNLSNAHDMRFENINKMPNILSKNRKLVEGVLFDKQRPRDSSAIINKNSLAHLDYQTEHNSEKKVIGHMSMEKMSSKRFNYLNNPNSQPALIMREIHGDRSFDSITAKEQKDQNSHKRPIGGHIPLKRQSKKGDDRYSYIQKPTSMYSSKILTPVSKEKSPH